MISRLVLRPCTRAVRRRGFATAAPTSSFETYDVGGIKVASRDSQIPFTKLAVVAKAGTRYQPQPGMTAGLEEFAFKNTQRRSALRIVREYELLGGRVIAAHTREALVIQVAFPRDDLPYFAELLAEVMSQTRYTSHEFHEDVERVVQLKRAELASNTSVLALNAVHDVAFHTGLGFPWYPTSSPIKPYLDENSLASFAETAYAKDNIVLVADGASHGNVSKWVGKFFQDVPSGSSRLGLNATPSKYHGGEQRVGHSGGNAMVISFPTSGYGAPDPAIAVLAALLGGESTISRSPGFSLLSKISYGNARGRVSASNLAYSDAGLLAIQLSGTAPGVRLAAEDAIKALRSISEGSLSKEDLSNAIAKAKSDALDPVREVDNTLMFARPDLFRKSSLGQVKDVETLSPTPLSAEILSAGTRLLHTGATGPGQDVRKSFESVTAEKLKSAAKAIIDSKAAVAAVGDLHVLPFAVDLGLRV